MQAWEKFVAELEKEFGQETVDKWLHTLKVLRFDACNIYLEAKDSFQTLWFDEHIRPLLGRFVNGNQKQIKVHLEVAGLKPPLKKSKTEVKSTKAENPSPFYIAFEELDPTATLDEFQVTDDTLVAYRLIDELCTKLVDTKLQQMQSFSPQVPTPVSKSNYDFFNPIYLYGPTGSGKTHLLQAFAQKLRRVGYQVVYARAELFCDHVVRAIRMGEMAKFRERYRKADILIIDDVQVLGRKSATQEEFFHTFNTLHTDGKQILLAANVAPQSLQFIEPRLISRFEWGIVLTLRAPQKRELCKILERKAKVFQFPLNSRTAEFLAETFATNPKSAVRALEALMFRTHINKGGQKRELPLTQVKQLLSDLIEEEKARAITADRIIATVAEHYSIPTEDLISKSQAREYVIPRQIAMYLCRELLKEPYMKIGDLFERDHSTVMSAIRQVQKQLGMLDSDLAPTLASIQQKL